MNTSNASATSGFFQDPPVIPPQISYAPSKTTTTASITADDKPLARAINLYLSPEGKRQVGPKLHDHARHVLHPSITQLTVDAETQPPFLRPLTTFGNTNLVDPLWTSEAWKTLKRSAVRRHIFSKIYNSTSQAQPSWNLRVEQFATGHLGTAADALVGCPMAMTDGAAALISRHLSEPDGDQPGYRRVLHETLARLISNDPSYAWTSGQWMTERPGGSDIRNTETFAYRLPSPTPEDVDTIGLPLGPWSISGFKWFSSATDCDVTILLAQTSEGISAFLCPTRRRRPLPSSSPSLSSTEPNGLRLSRLKSKLGTRALPTAELELVNTRGFLLGRPGQGVKEISSILNTTRMHTALGSVGLWGRALAVSRAFSRVRRARGVLLQDNAVHARWMAGETVKYAAGMQLAFFGAGLLGASEMGWEAAVEGSQAEGLIPREERDLKVLLRVLTPVIKAHVSVAAVHGVRECLESLGGVGYCENNEDGGLLNLARLFRDVNVQPVWEGTVNVMGEDLVRVLRGSPAMAVFSAWVRDVVGLCRGRFPDEAAYVLSRLEALSGLTRGAKVEQLLYDSRAILEMMATIVTSVLFMFDATTDGDEAAVAMARRWVRSKGLETESSTVQEMQSIDRLIFMGEAGSGRRAKI